MTTPLTDSQRVVVTGLGATTPVGGDVPEHLAGLLAGRSGVRVADRGLGRRRCRCTSRHRRRSTRPRCWPASRSSATDRSGQFALVAAREAWADAGTPDDRPRAARRRHRHRHRRRPDAARPATTCCEEQGRRAGCAAHRADAHAQRRRRARRPRARRPRRRAHAGERLRVRRRGDRVRRRHDPQRPRRRRRRRRHRGGASTRCRWPAFARCRRSRRATTSRSAPRGPYDKGRDGFVLGEGAGDRWCSRPPSTRKARGAHDLRRDRRRRHRRPTPTTSPQPDPAAPGAARAMPMRPARRRARRRRDVVHINAHATSTPVGDVAEAQAIRAALGDAADASRVGAPSRCTGHLLGAAGAVETIADRARAARPASPRPRATSTTPTTTSTSTSSRRAAHAARRAARRAEQLVRLRRPQRRLAVRSADAVTALPPPSAPPVHAAARRDPRSPRLRLDALLDPGIARADHRRGRLAACSPASAGSTAPRSSPSAPTPTIQGGAMGDAGLRRDRSPRTTARSPTAARRSACGTPAARGCARACRRCTRSAAIFAAMTRASGRIPQISRRARPGGRRRGVRPGAHRRRRPRPGGPGLRHRPGRRALGHRRGRRLRCGSAARSRTAAAAASSHVVADRRRRRYAEARRLAACSATSGDRRRGRRPRPAGLPAGLARGGRTTCTRWSTRLLDEGTRARAAPAVGAEHRDRRWAGSAAAPSACIANNPLRLGGCLDSASAEKAARFVRMCDAFGVPLVVVVDVPGLPARRRPGVGRRRAPRREAAARVRRGDRAAGDAGDPQGLRRRVHRDELPLARRDQGLRLARRRGRGDGRGRGGADPAPPPARRGARRASAREVEAGARRRARAARRRPRPGPEIGVVDEVIEPTRTRSRARRGHRRGAPPTAAATATSRCRASAS